MVLEASSVPSPTVQSAVPSRTSITLSDPTSLVSSHLLRPRTNHVSGCCPNKVIINLSTALVIPDYGLYYTEPIESFHPSFYAISDGSLIAPPFVGDLSGAMLTLFVTGMLTSLFVRNVVVSGDYLRRVKIKKKALFYLLFLSQILAPVGLIPVFLSSFDQSFNCTLVVILSYITAIVSLALLITGILGLKAYKCLNNSRTVLVMLILFQCASSAIAVLDISGTHGERRLTGGCVRASILFYTQIFVWIQVVESCFICCCFIYAAFKSRGSSSVRGRLSLQTSMESMPIEVPADSDRANPTLRGWWDYASEPSTEAASQAHAPTPKNYNPPSHRSKPKMARLIGRGINKISLRGPRAKVSREMDTQSILLTTRGPSPTPSSLSRLSKLVFNIHLFQKVVDNELLYTALITATCVIVAVLAAIALNFKNGLTVTGWIALNWCFISLLAIHSFGRVVRRHERDAFLQDSLPHSSTLIKGRAVKRISRNSRVPRFAEHSLARPKRNGRARDIEDPFADTRRLTLSSFAASSNISLTLDDPDIPDDLDSCAASLSSTPIVRN